MKQFWFNYLIFSFFASLFGSDFHEEFLKDVSFNIHQADVCEFIESFQDLSYVESSGDDRDIRPIYVAAQGDFERTLAFYLGEGRISHLIGVIHTPTPATPLCTEGEVSTDLVNESMEDDLRRLYTVMKRPEIIRDYMEKGGILIAAYPENGLLERTEEQRAIFQNVKELYSENLIDRPLSCAVLDKKMIGATYFFQTEEDEWMMFAIMAPQANAPEDDRVWGMWFGLLGDPIINKRATFVLDFLESLN